MGSFGFIQEFTFADQARKKKHGSGSVAELREKTCIVCSALVQSWTFMDSISGQVLHMMM